MGVADLIKKFDTSSSEKVDIKIFQPDQVSALAKSGLKIEQNDGGEVRTSPKKAKAVGIATATRQVVVSDKQEAAPKAEVVTEKEEKVEEPVKEEVEEPVKVEAAKVEVEEPVKKETTKVEVEEPVKKETTKVEVEEPVKKETTKVEVEEPVKKETTKVEVEEPVKKETTKEPVKAEKVEETAKEPVKAEKVEEPVKESTKETEAVEESTKEPVEDTEVDVEDVADEASETTTVGTGSNLRQEKEENQQKQKEEKEQQKEVSEPSDSMTEYLASTKDMPKPALDTRLGRDDPFVFGTRFIPEGDEDAIWNHNSWDHFQFTQEDVDNAKAKIELQKEVTDKEKYLGETAHKHWDSFYSQHKENFFKDRKWLAIEFPILSEVTEPEYGPVHVVEVGCGVGNTFNCILKDNKNPGLKIHASDYSYTAIDLIKENEFYQEEHKRGTVIADRWDITDPNLPVEEGSVDVIIMIFVFSALEPKQWKAAIDNAARLLKKGGKILFRDYGRYDLAQVRFKGEKILAPNFYIRGDGTRVYFFTDEEIEEIFTGDDQFNKVKIGIDRRLLVNRKKKIKMYRQWIQAVFEKK